MIIADIAAFNALDPRRRDRFLRSAQWYDAALGVWSTRYGAGLGALVSAIETLAWEERPADFCRRADGRSPHASHSRPGCLVCLQP